MNPKRLHIVCFDIPYPATYGGAIDVYYRLRALHEAGVLITLHCTYKGALTHYPELENICAEVFYYPRTISPLALFSRLPLAVAGRPNSDILHNLLRDDAPILYEGLVSCGTIDAPELRNRKKYFRECNVEHDYYRALADASRSLRDKVYYRVEARRLRRFEQVLRHATGIFALAHQDEAHFRDAFPAIPTAYIPCFHAQSSLTCADGLGSAILYHGNLCVEENRLAADYIIRHIAPALPDLPFIIAGRYQGDHWQTPAPENVRFVFSPDADTMQRLIREAQLHLLLTFQPTGLKLKLLNVLYEGRHVVCNPDMVCGTELAALCHVEPTDDALIRACRTLYSTPFTADDILKRQTVLTTFDNSPLVRLLCDTIFPEK